LFPKKLIGADPIFSITLDSILNQPTTYQDQAQYNLIAEKSPRQYGIIHNDNQIYLNTLFLIVVPVTLAHLYH
jgi:hypothetical protein